MTKINSSEWRIVELQRQCNDCVTELSKKEREIATLGAHVNDLQFQLLRSETISSLARRLFHEIDKKIMLQLTRNGQKKPKVHRPSLKIDLNGDESYKQLIEVAKMYDIQEFFIYRSKLSNNQLRIHYRIIAKLYRVVRDSMLYLGNSVHSRVKKVI